MESVIYHCSSSIKADLGGWKLSNRLWRNTENSRELCENASLVSLLQFGVIRSKSQAQMFRENIIRSIPIQGHEQTNSGHPQDLYAYFMYSSVW